MIDDRAAGPAKLTKKTSPGVDIVTLERSSSREHFITVGRRDGDSPGDLLGRAGRAVRELSGQVVSAEVYGIPESAPAQAGSLCEVLGDEETPVTWIKNTNSAQLYGMHLWLVEGVPVESVRLEESLVGRAFTDGEVRYCRLGGLQPPDASADRSQQAGQLLELMMASLAVEGMSFANVLRTWFYNDDILDWYGDFNKVRTRFFNKYGIFDQLVPASTGIGGSNPAGTALTGGVLAVDAAQEAARAFEVLSPLQSSATDYGSSFSRAVELEAHDHRRLFVSGTASIDRGGATVHVGNVEAQVALTMEVVGAILQSRQMDWPDVTRALAYFKFGQDAPLLAQYCRAQGIAPFPVVVVENDVCRDDLLFEVEVDAVALRS